MNKATRIVESNGGLSTKYGGGKVIKGCVTITVALEAANLLNDYTNAIKMGNTRQMDCVFRDFMANMPDIGTLVRASIFDDAYKFHNEMKVFAMKKKAKS